MYPRSSTPYADFLYRAKAKHGGKFTEEHLAPQFRSFFDSGQRVKVHFYDLPESDNLTGTIGGTTGWKPCFLLMRTSRSLGSPYTLSAKDSIIAVKVGRKYEPVRR